VQQANPQQAELAYAAGYFDGEGALHLQVQRRNGRVHQKCLNVTVNSSDRDTLLWLASLFGGSVLLYQNRSPLTRKRMYNWKLSGSATRNFLELILPHLRYKKEYAAFCIAAWDFRTDTERFEEACRTGKQRWGRAAAETEWNGAGNGDATVRSEGTVQPSEVAEMTTRS